jgi:hypothetical protein
VPARTCTGDIAIATTSSTEADIAPTAAAGSTSGPVPAADQTGPAPATSTVGTEEPAASTQGVGVPSQDGKSWLEAFAAECPDTQRANDFSNNFVPKQGVDYLWVEELARHRRDEITNIFESLDTKATTITTYLTSGLGVFTIASLASVWSAKVPVHVLVYAMPALIFAIAAVVMALLARWPRNVLQPPKAETGVRFAERFPNDTLRARALTIPLWELCNAVLAKRTGDKAWYVAWSFILMACSIITLPLPLLYVLLWGVTP